MILPRYLHRQVAISALLTLVVLLGVLSALFLAELLSQATQGLMSGQHLLLLLVLRLPEAFLMVAPLALLMGVLFALGQSSEAGEVTIARASGVSFWACFKPIVGLAFVWALIVLLVAGWAAPWASQKSDEVVAWGAERALLASIQAGQFDRLKQGQLTVYVASVDAQSGELSDVFLQHAGSDVEEIVSAPSGRVWQDAADQSRYLSLSQGHQVRRSSAGDWTRLVFQQNDVRLPPASEGLVAATEMGLSLIELLPLDNVRSWREWHWRWASPTGTLLMGLLAIPLAWRGPRGGRFGPLVVAMLVYLIYSNAVHVRLVLMEGSGSMDGFGLWPVHGALCLVAATLWAWRWRRW
jgi:lipopolysaccharide export system permease protein